MSRSSPRRTRPTRPTSPLDALRERGSPSHDGLAARLVDFERRPTGCGSSSSPPAGRCGWSRTRRASSLVGALHRARRRRPLAGRAPRGLAGLVGRPLGARRRRLGRGRREPGRHDAPRARGGVVGQPERLQVEALVRLPSGLVLLVGQAWLADGRDGHARRRARRLRLVAGRRVELAGRGRRAAAPDGRLVLVPR